MEPVPTNLDAYTRRIGYTGPLEPTLDVLRELSWLHQLAIPFENLDIFLLKRPISLEPGAVFAKLVGQARGGFCFEQNGLLAQVLQAIGFGVTRGYATWQPETGDRIVPFDHQVLRVEIPSESHPWLADVGFGRDNPAGPLPLLDGEDIRLERSGIAYRVSQRDDPDLQWTIEQRHPEQDWRILYDLDLRPRQIAEFEHRRQFHQHSPESHFSQGVICSRPIDGGRVTVASNTLILTRNGQREETPLEGLSATLQALDTWFNIRLDEAEIIRRSETPS